MHMGLREQGKVPALGGRPQTQTSLGLAPRRRFLAVSTVTKCLRSLGVPIPMQTPAGDRLLPRRKASTAPGWGLEMRGAGP